MSKFRKDSGKNPPAVNTSALPDIVFMLLFFFMVATTTKENDPGLKIKRPYATAVDDVTILKQTNSIDFLYVGMPVDKRLGNIPRLVADGQLIDVNGKNGVGSWKTMKMAGRTENIESILTCMKIDENIEMNLVESIKLELIEVNALKVGYSAANKKGKK